MKKNNLNFPIKDSNMPLFYGALIVLIIVALVLANILGSVDIDPSWIFKIIINNITKKEIFEVLWPKNIESIIWTLRMPRTIMAFIVGAGLSISGLLMQALTKNSLADPYVLGLSSGASAGAVSVIMFGLFSFAGNYSVPVGASLGAIIAAFAALKIATIDGKITSTQMVLSGIAISALFSAMTNIIIYGSPNSSKVKTAIFWMMGSLSGATWEKTKYIFIIFIILSSLIFFLHKTLDAMMLGDEIATTLGVNLKATKPLTILFCTILTGSIVSVSGVIGFVGLIVPHITRTIVGTSHKKLIPSSLLIGGIFMILCDIISRVIVSPEELPIGVVTAFFGAPFFLYLIRKDKKGQ